MRWGLATCSSWVLVPVCYGVIKAVDNTQAPASHSYEDLASFNVEALSDCLGQCSFNIEDLSECLG